MSILKMDKDNKDDDAESIKKTAPGDGKKAKPKRSSRKKHVQISDIVDQAPPEREIAPENEPISSQNSCRIMESTTAENVVTDFLEEPPNRASVPTAVAVNFAVTASTFFPMLRLQDPKDGSNPQPDKNSNPSNPSTGISAEVEAEAEAEPEDNAEESALIATRGSVEEARRDAAEHDAAMAKNIDYEDSEADLPDDAVVSQMDDYNYLDRQPTDEEVEHSEAVDSNAQEEPSEVLDASIAAGYVRSLADSLQAREARLSEADSPAARAAEAAMARASVNMDPHKDGIPCDCMLRALQAIPEEEREFKIRKIQCQCALLKFAEQDPSLMPDDEPPVKLQRNEAPYKDNFDGTNERDSNASRSSAEDGAKPHTSSEPKRAAKENIYTKPMIGVLKVTNDEVCFSVWSTPDFKMLTAEKAPLTTLKPATGWVEQDPADIIFQCFQTINKLCCRLQQQDCSLELIQGIAIVNEPNTVVAWHSNSNKALYNAILGKDTRTQPMVDEMIRRNSNDENKFKNTTGLPLSTFYSAPKLRWLMDNVDEVQQASEEGRLRVGTLESWIMWHLTDGRMHVSDCTNAASTMLMNIKLLRWDPTLLKEFKVDNHSLPEICCNSEDFGRITTCRCVLVDIPVTTMIALPNSLFIGTQAMEPGQTVASSSDEGSFTMCNIGEDCIIDKSTVATTIAYKMSPSEPPVYTLVGAMPSVKHLMETFGTNPRTVPQEDSISRRSDRSRRSDYSRGSVRRSLLRPAPSPTNTQSIQSVGTADLPHAAGLADALSAVPSDNVVRRSSARAGSRVSNLRRAPLEDETDLDAEAEPEPEPEPSINDSLPPLYEDDRPASQRPSLLQRLSRNSRNSRRNSRNSGNPASRGFFSGPFFFSAAPLGPDGRPSGLLADNEEEEEEEEAEAAEPDDIAPRSARGSARQSGAPSARASARPSASPSSRPSARDFEPISARPSARQPSRESARALPHDSPRDSSRESARDAGRPSTRDSSRESSRPSARSTGRDSSRESGRPSLRDVGRQSGRPNDILYNVPRPSARDTVRPSGRDTTRSDERESPRSARRNSNRRAGRGNRNIVDSYDDLQEPVMFIPPGNGIYEPTWRPGHTGYFTGITDDTTPDDIKQAVLEARDFQTRAVVDAVDDISPHKVSEINAAGDLANEPKAMQLVANLTEVDVVRGNENMPEDYGGAILGAQPRDLAPLTPRKLDELRGNPKVYHPQYNSEADSQRDRYDRWRKHLPPKKSSKGFLESIPGYSLLPLGLQQLLHGEINDDNRLLLQALIAALLLLLGFYLFRRMTRKATTEEVVERSCGCAKKKLKKLF